MITGLSDSHSRHNQPIILSCVVHLSWPWSSGNFFSELEMFKKHNLKMFLTFVIYSQKVYFLPFWLCLWDKYSAFQTNLPCLWDMVTCQPLKDWVKGRCRQIHAFLRQTYCLLYLLISELGSWGVIFSVGSFCYQFNLNSNIDSLLTQW